MMLTHGTRIGRSDEDKFFYHQTCMNFIDNQVYKGFTVIDFDINKELDEGQRTIIRNKLISSYIHASSFIQHKKKISIHSM